MATNVFKAQIKLDWAGDAEYYALVEAEPAVQVFWAPQSPFRQMFERLDISAVIELACGHGRHTSYIIKNLRCGSVLLVDVNASNIAFCVERFKEFPNVSWMVNDGSSLSGVDDASATSLFCYDAMVHFEYDDVAAYLQEISRVLVRGGKALLHHSNNDRHPGRLYSENEHYRNFMSANLFSHMAQRAMLRVVEQRLLDWGEAKELDALTLVEKP
jgi:ubiquinone/menaquinone biosynthesis C-methylase UbiE